MNLGPMEILVILLVALVLFGPNRLPELGKSLGKGIREFKRGTQGLKDELELSLKDAPAASQPSSAPAASAQPVPVPPAQSQPVPAQPVPAQPVSVQPVPVQPPAAEAVYSAVPGGVVGTAAAQPEPPAVAPRASDLAVAPAVQMPVEAAAHTSAPSPTGDAPHRA